MRTLVMGQTVFGNNGYGLLRQGVVKKIEEHSHGVWITLKVDDLHMGALHIAYPLNQISTDMAGAST